MDDHFLMERLSTAPGAMYCMKAIFRLAGFATDDKRDQVSQAPVVPGVQYDLVPEVPEVSVPELKAARRIAQTDVAARANTLRPGAAGKLYGALLFLISHLFEHSLRGLLQEVSDRQHMKGPHNKVARFLPENKRLLDALLGLRQALVDLSPRILRPRLPAGTHVTLCTDGMETPGKPFGTGCLIRVPWSGLQQWCYSPVPSGVRDQWKKTVKCRKTGKKAPKRHIVNIEAYGALLGIFTWLRSMPKGTRVVLFVDSSNIFAMLCRGSAREKDTRITISTILEWTEILSLHLWVEWVEGESNIAGTPSRWGTESPSDQRKIVNDLRNLGAHQILVAEQDCPGMLMS